MKTFFMGGGKYACLLHSMFSERVEVLGYFDDVSSTSLLTERYQVPHLGSSDVAASMLEECPEMMIAIGSEGDMSVRQRYYARLRAAGFHFPVLVHPSAYVSPESVIGDGTVIQYNAVVHPFVRIGANCVVSSAAIIAHDSVIHDNVYVGPGAIVNGSVAVGGDTFLGAGAIVIQKKNIGRGCTIAAGACIVRDVPDEVMVAGVPGAIRRR
jgi:sugar O-acyltransferase (sialic acid O-acetyltransferase NeuD family)